VRFIKLDLPLSSSMLRLELAKPDQRKAALRKIPSVVARYIEEHNLYLASES
jgi:nicotinic acid mononucleotide adenylyltransferase